MTARELAKRLGVHETTVTRQLRYLRLPEDLQQQVVSGEISKTSAREIARLKNEAEQRALLKESKRDGMKSADVAAAVSKKRKRSPPKPRQQTRNEKPCTLFTEHGHVQVKPVTTERVTYDLIERCLEDALEEVRHRKRNRVTY